jgi:FkbM family methyltransferase
MPFIYYYNNNEPIKISDNTKKIANTSFLDNGSLSEYDSIILFFNIIPKDKKINIIDIGANAGLYSLYAKYSPNAHFYSFEPFDINYNLLIENILLNDIKNINTYKIALGDKECKSILNTCTSHSGLHTMGNNPLRFNDIKPVEIDVNTIDNIFFNNNINVDYIKIDTEGYEYYILKGGEKTIKKNKPIIQIEYNVTNMKQCNITPKQLMNYINNELGYKIYNLTNEELIIIPN